MHHIVLSHRDTRTFPRSVEAARAARTFVATTLRSVGADGLTDDAALLVSELVTNAVLHTSSEQIVVEVQTAEEGRIRCDVRDHAPDQLPDVRPVDLGTVGGSGMHIVDKLATRWGCAADGDQKVVWFELVEGSPDA